MGVNISVYRITGARDTEGWLYTDSCREEFESRGERAFTREVPIEWEHIDEAPQDYPSMSHSYQRPKDFDKAIQQAIEFGRQDIADLFRKMKDNPNLWIFISY